MLVNGDALGGRWWRVQRDWDQERWLNPRIVVECDDSWDANTGTHAHHDEDFPYDPPQSKLVTVEVDNWSLCQVGT